jgi:hypothetical protein
MNKITPADISDPQEISRAPKRSGRVRNPNRARVRGMAFKASRGIEDIYDLTYIRKDRQPLPGGGVGHGAA